MLIDIILTIKAKGGGDQHPKCGQPTWIFFGHKQLRNQLGNFYNLLKL
jgi:hypothetical protein